MRKKLKTFLGLATVVLAGLIGGWMIWISMKSQALVQPQESAISNYGLEIREIKVGEKWIRVELAKTDIERAKGLSGRPSLSPNTGLLFIFPRPSYYSFWMKDMKIPLDLIWIDESWMVIDITRNVSPDTYPLGYQPRQAAKFVLEVNAG